MFGIEQKVEKAARKGAAFSAAALFASVGAAFLTFAAWLVLTELRTELFAACVIGAAYVGAAALAVAWGMKESPKSHDKRSVTGRAPNGDDLTPLQMVAVSFVQGFEQGRQTNRSA